MTAPDPRKSESEWVCPKCGQVMPGPDVLCSGSFLDRDHPANVQPQPREATSWPAPNSNPEPRKSESAPEPRDDLVVFDPAFPRAHWKVKGVAADGRIEAQRMSPPQIWHSWDQAGWERAWRNGWLKEATDG